MRINPVHTQRFIHLLTIYPLGLIALSAVHILAPQRSGLLAVSQIFSLYLFAPLVVLIPVALHRQARVLLLTLVVCAGIFGLRFVPALTPLPFEHAAEDRAITAMTWNILYRNRDIEQLQEVLRTTPAMVVGLQELAPHQANAIEADEHIRQRYPYQILDTRNRSAGLGLLSAYPILEYGRDNHPRWLWARLQLGNGQSVMVATVHIPAADIEMKRKYVVVGYDPSVRDREIRLLREKIAPYLESDEPLLLIGDFNLTPQEQIYAELTPGLHDAHHQAGWGFGHTWRQWRRLPFGLIRIDYLFSNHRLAPVQVHTDCTPRGSDHCIVTGDFVLQ